MLTKQDESAVAAQDALSRVFDSGYAAGREEGHSYGYEDALRDTICDLEERIGRVVSRCGEDEGVAA